MVIDLLRASKICKALLLLLCALMTVQNVADAQETFPPTVRREANTAWKIEGFVRAPSGLPVSNAEYRVESGTYYQPMWRSNSSLIEQGHVDAFGKFNVFVRSWDFVVASAPGYAPTAIGSPEASSIEIVLDEGRTVSGLVKLPDGKPAVNAVVRPVTFLCPLTEHQLSNVSVSEQAIHPGTKFRSIGIPESGEPWAVHTDKDGRFTLERIPTDSRVLVAIELAGYQTQAVWVKPPNDSNDNFYPQFELKSDVFETSLKPSFVLKLSGRNEATGKTEKISRIFVQAGFVKPQDVKLSNTNLYVVDFQAAVDVETSLQSMSGGASIWVEPENEALMGFRFSLDRIGTKGELEKIISFRAGKLLRGAVKSASGKPISGVNLLWNGSNRNNYSGEGDFPKIDIQTKEDGSFAIPVPESDGSLSVIGGVDGFRTVDSWEWINGPRYGSEEFAEKFSREITEDVLATGGPINFELEPTSEIRFRVVRPNGQAEQDAIISASAKSPASLTGGPFRTYRRETLTTDVDGKATLVNWYNHAGWLAQAHRILEERDVQKRQNLLKTTSAAGYPTIVEAFSNSGLLQGSAVIPLPVQGSKREPVEVEVKLTESAAVLGRTIDQDGQPMKDLKVSLTRTNSGSQIWETKTRADGYFLATGLLPGNDYTIKLGDRDVKPLGADFDRIQLNIKDKLMPGKTIEIETIECFDCRHMLGDLPELNIEGLKQPEAFEAIASYVELKLSSVPKEDPRFPSRSTADPIPVFYERLAAIIMPKLKEAGDLNQGSEVELKQLTKISSLFLPPSLDSDFAGETRVRLFVEDRLLEKFSKHPNAQPALLAIAETLGREELSGVWKRLYDRSNFASTKQKAGIKAAMVLAQSVGNYGSTGNSADQFEARFRALENHLSDMEGLSAVKRDIDFDMLQSQIDAFRKEFQSRYDFNENNDVPAGYRYDPGRLKRIFDRLDLFVDRLR